jgi:hypothetical protein
MKKLLVLFVIIFLSQILKAQPATDTLFKMGWTPKGVVSVNLSQIAFDNWIQGGENSMSFLSLIKAGAYYRSKAWFIANRLKIQYGGANTSSRYITTDNELRLENIFIRDVGWKISPYFSNEVRTGIVNGYEFSGDAKNQVTAFFDPGYINQALGFIFAKKVFTTRLGIGLQETFTNKFTKYSDDDKTSEIEKFKIETGVESVSETAYEFMKNIIYTGRLRLFSRFNSLDVWDVNWENVFTAKVNDYINVNFTYNLIYQKDQTYRTQTKEALQVGFSYVLF